MSTRFSVWIDTPSTGTGGNILDYATFASDTQKISGFIAGTAASSIRVNTALRESTLVISALMDAMAPNATIDVSSSLAQVKTEINRYYNQFVIGGRWDNVSNTLKLTLKSGSTVDIPITSFSGITVESARKDGEGNVITNTYATKTELNNAKAEAISSGASQGAADAIEEIESRGYITENDSCAYATEAGSADTANSATNATNAVNDGNGNKIDETYYPASNPNGFITSSDGMEFAQKIGINAQTHPQIGSTTVPVYVNSNGNVVPASSFDQNEATVSFTRTGGTNSSTLTGYARKYGKMCFLTCTCKTDLGDQYETDPGQNVWEGTTPAAYRPPHDIETCAYYEDVIVGLRIRANGSTTVRLTGARSKILSGGAHFSITYFID